MVRPTYLNFIDDRGVVSAFVCVIAFGFAPFQCGVVIDGPAPLNHAAELVTGSVSGLADWLRNHGFAFVRFSHNNESIIQQVASSPAALRVNPFPFIPQYGGELVVPLKTNDSEMLAGFQQIARRDIKKAKEAQCLIKQSNNVDELIRMWPIFTKRAKQKNIRIGSLKGYELIFRHSPRNDLVRIYTAF